MGRILGMLDFLHFSPTVLILGSVCFPSFSSSNNFLLVSDLNRFVETAQRGKKPHQSLTLSSSENLLVIAVIDSNSAVLFTPRI